MNLLLGFPASEKVGKAVKKVEKDAEKKAKWTLSTLKKRVPGWVIKAAGLYYNINKRDFEDVKINKKTNELFSRSSVSIKGENLENLTFTYRAKKKPILALTSNLKQNRVKIKKTPKNWPMREKKQKDERTQDWIFGGGFRITKEKKAGKNSASVQYLKLANGIAKKTSLKMLAYTQKEPNGKWMMHVYKTLPITFMLKNPKVQAYYSGKIEETIKKKMA